MAVDTALTAFAKAATGEDGLGRAVVINCAAYTAVDDAESEHDAAYAVNAAGPTHLAMAAARLGLGSDPRLDRLRLPRQRHPALRIDDPTGPRSVYGASKLAGEQAVLDAHPEAHVVRTAWVWGANGSNFVKTIGQLEAARPTISVVDDQRGTPTYAADLAAGLLELADSDLPGGLLQLTNAGETTWFDFARAIFSRARRRPGPRAADQYREFPTAGAAAGLFRAVDRRLDRRRSDSAA